MDVHELHEGVACRVPLWVRPPQLQLLPTSLGRGEGVVAIADWEEDHALVLARAVALPEALGVRQAPQGLDDAVHGVAGSHVPARQAAAALHQLEVVELLEGVPPPRERLDDGLVGVVDQHQDVGQLERRLLADGDSRRQPLGDGLLRGADEALAPFLKAVEVQVQSHEQALPARDEGRLAVDEDETGVLRHEEAVAVELVHLVLDPLDDELVVLLVAQVDLWKDEVQRRGRLAHEVFDVLPVLRLGRVLVAGDDAPLREVQALAGQQDPRDLEADVREKELVRAAEGLVAAGPDADLREAVGLPREIQDVAEQNGEGDVAHAARHRRDLRGYFHGLVEADVPHDPHRARLGVRGAVHAHVDHHSAGLEPGALDQLRTAGARHQDVRTAHDALDVERLGVADGDGAVVGREERGDGRPDRVGAAQDDGRPAREADARAEQQLHDGRGHRRPGGGLHAVHVAPGGEEAAEVREGEPVDVFGGADGLDDPRLVQVWGQGQLDKDPVHVAVGHEARDQAEEPLLGDALGEAHQLHAHGAALRHLGLQARVVGVVHLVRLDAVRPLEAPEALQELAVVVVAHLDDGQAGHEPVLGLELQRGGPDVAAQLRRHLAAVDELAAVPAGPGAPRAVPCAAHG
mmetsp:Transcript_8990/g.27978  ORF Transcript_8990/g.27978 Transcript_8990/m.27978 type:complete len:634 (-) Transcript_8990:72-1973(-)